MRINCEIRTGFAEANTCQGLGVTLVYIAASRHGITTDVEVAGLPPGQRHTFDLEEQRTLVVLSEGRKVSIVLQSISRVENKELKKGMIYEFLFSDEVDPVGTGE
jgi:hypothetical protein